MTILGEFHKNVMSIFGKTKKQRQIEDFRARNQPMPCKICGAPAKHGIFRNPAYATEFYCDDHVPKRRRNGRK